MNLNQIVNMVMRMVMRKGLNWGINKGAGMLAKRNPAAKPPVTGAPATPAEIEQAQNAKALAKRARQAARITKRIGR